MNQQEFVQKWRKVTAADRKSEVQLYQEHLFDLCQLVGHPTPLEIDPGRTFFTVEEGVTKEDGGYGRADVWYKGHFAIEYKKPGGDLEKAYKQLRQYRDSLQNPRLLIVCDFHRLIIHTNFSDTVNRELTLTLDDIATNDGLRHIRNMFFNVEAFRPDVTPEQVTKDAASKFGQLATYLARWGDSPHDIAHYLIRLLFCLFSEDIDLLPKNLFSRLVAEGKRNPKAFNTKIRDLFAAMATGANFGEHTIEYFDGGLFNDDSVIEMDADALAILSSVTQLDWSAIEPAISGTLFTRSLDPSQRAKLGAQYTSKEDILLVVEPVLMAPLRREWEEIKAKVRELAERRNTAPNKAVLTNLTKQMTALLMGFADKIRNIKVLDAACGSGNFLYVSLRLLLDLEKEVSNFCGEMGLQPFFPEVSPLQLYGIEINDYAHELAQATVWIGYLQWLHENGYGVPKDPILKPLNNIRHMDAILAFDDDGRPVDPEWPEADVIVGNPPFLGGNKIRQELGDKYVESLFALYDGRVPAFADLVCYWFERASTKIRVGRSVRAGLLATNSIRQSVNRKVLERIKETGDIFFAWSDRPWILDGAAVRVSMIGFDNGDEKYHELNGIMVKGINADLTADMDLSMAHPLSENANVCFYGSQQKGSFNISESEAKKLIAEPNSFGKDLRKVVKRGLNSMQLLQRTEETWVIDFGLDMSLEEASQYESAFRYLKDVVYPEREKRSEKRQRDFWWLHARPSPGYRRILASRDRYIVTSSVSKYRIFAWVGSDVLVNHRLLVFDRADDYFFGVLHSMAHEVWSLRMGSTLEDRPCYTPTTCFETYPFPWPPSKEPHADPRVQAIADAARDLVAKRDEWLNPPDVFGAELDKRTLTNLYNLRPDWLAAAHKRLDDAVFDAYGWPHDLSDEEILARLLALNLARASIKPSIDLGTEGTL